MPLFTELSKRLIFAVIGMTVMSSEACGRSGGSELLRGHPQMGTYEVTVKRELRDHLEFS